MSARPYQISQVENVIESLSINRKVLLQLPTGGGKTWEFAMIAERYVRNTEKAVLIIVDRVELLSQAYATINDRGIRPRIINADTKHYQVARVYISMIESLVGRLDLFTNVGLVIIDEAHVANFNKAHSIFLEELIIGVTATPISSSKKNPLNRYYNDIIVGPQISELIDDGYLCKNITKCPKEIVDRAKLSYDKMTGDFNEKSMAQEFTLPKLVVNPVNQYIKFCENFECGKKTIVFNVNKEHSKKVDQAFRLMGFNSRHLDSDASDEVRAETLKWFRENEDAILNNVGLFTRGFDEPTIANVIINFSTLAITKYLQCCGRGGRIIDDYFINKNQHLYPYKLKHKNYFQIIDLGGNAVSGLGDWSDDRNWKFIFNNPEIPGDGLAPTKICPNCEGLLHAAKMTCDLPLPDFSICGYEFQRKQRPQEKLDMEMVTVTTGVNVDEIVERFKHKYTYYPFFRLGEEVVANLFSRLNGWPTEEQIAAGFKSYWNLCMDWHKKYMAGKSMLGGKIEPNDIVNSSWHIQRARRNYETLIQKRKDGLPPFDYYSQIHTNFDTNYESHIERVITDVISTMYSEEI